MCYTFVQQRPSKQPLARESSRVRGHLLLCSSLWASLDYGTNSHPLRFPKCTGMFVGDGAVENTAAAQLSA